MRWRSTLCLSVLLISTQVRAAATPSYAWPTHGQGVGPGGFATITAVHPRHGQTIRGPDTVVRITSDNPRATVHLLVDGKVIGSDGLPLGKQPLDLYEIAAEEFSQSLTVEIPMRGLAPGVHTVEIREGTRGSSLPRINAQRLAFLVQ